MPGSSNQRYRRRTHRADDCDLGPPQVKRGLHDIIDLGARKVEEGECPDVVERAKREGYVSRAGLSGPRHDRHKDTSDKVQ